MTRKRRRHQDTSISLHPLPFDEAIKELANTPMHVDTEAEESGKVTQADPLLAA